MNKIACLYTVARYIQDPIRNEARNIGIIVQCRDAGYIDCKFLKDTRAKLSTTATRSDFEIIRAYIKEFIENFKPHSKFPSTKSLFPEEIGFLNESYLRNLAEKRMGKIQFTEPQGCLIDNPGQELRYLFDTFVGEEAEKEKLTKPSELKKEIKREFKKHGLLASPKKKEIIGFKIDAKFKGFSKVDHSVDFALRNGKLYLLETVDMRKKIEKYRAYETYKAAFKFDDLKKQRSKKEIVPYSIVALSDHEVDGDYMKILTAYSKVFRYYEEKDKFLHEMSKLAEPGSDLFKE